ncbi:MAG TPA: hypothetical protein VET88_11825 [Gammaproteobacteria bacterium]|nr:hypothetical protein [Gammaproteobacteria bacterium]
MPLFRPCQGKSVCRDDGHRCLVCGRTLDEIRRLRESLAQLTALAVEYGYDNSEQYTGYLARKLAKMIAGAQQREAHARTD